MVTHGDRVQVAFARPHSGCTRGLHAQQDRPHGSSRGQGQESNTTQHPGRGQQTEPLSYGFTTPASGARDGGWPQRLWLCVMSSLQNATWRTTRVQSPHVRQNGMVQVRQGIGEVPAKRCFVAQRVDPGALHPYKKVLPLCLGGRMRHPTRRQVVEAFLNHRLTLHGGFSLDRSGLCQHPLIDGVRHVGHQPALPRLAQEGCAGLQPRSPSRKRLVEQVQHTH